MNYKKCSLRLSKMHQSSFLKDRGKLKTDAIELLGFIIGSESFSIEFCKNLVERHKKLYNFCRFLCKQEAFFLSSNSLDYKLTHLIRTKHPPLVKQSCLKFDEEIHSICSWILGSAPPSDFFLPLSLGGSGICISTKMCELAYYSSRAMF
jgi:hypothetical protein